MVPERIFADREVTRLLGLTARRAAQLRRLALLGSTSGYTFRELVAIRAAVALLDSGATVRQIRQALDGLRRQQPQIGSPLSEVRLVVDGSRVLAETARVRFDPRTGQTVLALDVDTLEKDAAATLAMGLVRPLLPPAEEAETWFQRAMEWDADPARWEEAIDAYRRVVAIDPGYAAAWNNRGLLHHRLGQHGEARIAYRAALDADPACAEAAYNLGSLLEDLGDLPVSITWYQKALALAPDYADAHFNLAGVLGKAGRPREAIEHWRRYLDLDAASPWAQVARSHLEVVDRDDQR
jgi:tetratricopeptide (TPR) repeat protein